MRTLKFFVNLFFALKVTYATIDLTTLTSTQVFPILGNTNGINYQFPMRAAGDVNKDGKADIILGGYGNGNGMESAFLIYGTSTWDQAPVNIDFSIPSSLQSVTITTGNTADGFGAYVNSAGDLNGDGFADFMVGAYRKTSYEGEAYVIYGGENLQNPLNPSAFTSSSVGFTISTPEPNSYLGNPISKAGKVNGDDYDDIIVALPGLNGNTGAAVVIYGGLATSHGDLEISGPHASLNIPDAGFSILGNAAGDSFGSSVSNIGDINGDGYDDIIVGAPHKNSDRGAVYVIYGSQSPTFLDLSSSSLIPGSTGFTILGNAAGDFFGYAIQCVGDLNNDGYSDVIIGAPGQGAVHVIYGGGFSNVDLKNTVLDPAKDGFTIIESGSSGSFGFSVSSGDFDGDGKTELFVGTSGSIINEAAGYIINLSSKGTKETKFIG